MKAVINSEGAALYVWVKKSVPAKKTGFFNDSPGYQMLYTNDKGDAVFAFKRLLDQEEPIPHHLEKCTESEITKLEKRNERR